MLVRSVQPLVPGVPEKGMKEEEVLLLIQTPGHWAAVERNAVSYLMEDMETAPLDRVGIGGRRRSIADLLAALVVGRAPNCYHQVLWESIRHTEDWPERIQ